MRTLRRTCRRYVRIRSKQHSKSISEIHFLYTEPGRQWLIACHTHTQILDTAAASKVHIDKKLSLSLFGNKPAAALQVRSAVVPLVAGFFVRSQGTDLRGTTGRFRIGGKSLFMDYRAAFLAAVADAPPTPGSSRFQHRAVWNLRSADKGSEHVEAWCIMR